MCYRNVAIRLAQLIENDQIKLKFCIIFLTGPDQIGKICIIQA